MTSFEQTAPRRAANPAVFLAAAGIWVAASPLMADDRASFPWWNSVVTGLVITLFAVVRLLRPRHTAILSVLSAALGGWLVLAPFALGFTGQVDAAWNNKIVGMVVILLAAVSAFTAGDAADRRGREER